MKSILLTFFLILALFIPSKGQLIDKAQITISPFSFISTSHPSVKLGFDIISSKNIVFGFDFNFGNDLFVLNKQYKTDYIFYQIRPALKYNLISSNQHSLYVGLEYFYNQKTAIIYNSMFSAQYGYISFDKANYLKKKEGVHLLLGLKMFLKNHLMGEIYAAAGVYQSYTRFSDIENGKISFESYFFFPETAGYKSNLSIDIGLKIGLWFGKKIEEPVKFDYDLGN